MGFLFLMIGRVVDMYFGLNGVILSTSKKYKSDFAFTLLLIVCVYGFNLFLIPKYGIVGAAISTGFVYVIYNFLRGWYISRAYALNPFQFIQIKLMSYFGLFMGFYYLFSFYTDDFSFISSIFPRIIFKELMVFFGFLIPIYWLNLEPESTNFVRNWVKSKIKRN